MDDEAIKLEFELTRAESVVIRSRTPSRIRTVERIIGVMFVFAGVMTINEREHLWLTGVFLTCGITICLYWQIVIWLSTNSPSLFSASFPIQVESDARGVRIGNPLALKVAPHRFWWSRLSEIREDNFGITLLFDRNWDGLLIPWKAFEDVKQQTQFLDLARQHLKSRVQPETSVVSRNVNQNAS